MRMVWLVAPLAGCQLVFPLEEQPTGRRDPFTATVSLDDKLDVGLSQDVVAGDQIVGVIQANHFDTTLVDPDGWEVIDNYPDGGCADQEWHAFIVSLQVAEVRTFQLRFSSANDTIDALFVPYSAAGSVRPLLRMTPIDVPQASEVVFAESSAPAGSHVLIGDVGDQPAAEDPAGMQRVGSISNVVVFDRPVGNQVPEISVPVQAMRCVGMSELLLEP